MFSCLYGLLMFLLLFFVMVVVSGGYCKKSVLLNKNSWVSCYECGFSSNSISIKCFSVTYFTLLVFFVVFDLEISLLLKMPEQGLMFSNFIYYYFFLVVLIVGFVMEALLGYVRWGY